MNIKEIYAKVDSILDTLDFGALPEGFHEYRFAVYDSREICLDGKLIPYEDSFRGNTSLLCSGECIAIWDIAFAPIEDN